MSLYGSDRKAEASECSLFIDGHVHIGFRRGLWWRLFSFVYTFDLLHLDSLGRHIVF